MKIGDYTILIIVYRIVYVSHFSIFWVWCAWSPFSVYTISGRHEDCVEIYFSNSKYLSFWNDAPCHHKFVSWCQKKTRKQFDKQPLLSSKECSQYTCSTCTYISRPMGNFWFCCTTFIFWTLLYLLWPWLFCRQSDNSMITNTYSRAHIGETTRGMP